MEGPHFRLLSLIQKHPEIIQEEFKTKRA